jgi:aerobic-type carbon monoxide dehydrogenase small subunit (CoxS/CutS family)
MCALARHYGRPSLYVQGRIRLAIRLVVNGATASLDVDPSTPLLWALRETLALTGTKYGCGMAQCGACTVHVDGQATRACVMPVSAAAGKRVTTIEGLEGKLREALEQAWIEHDVPQCGYCQTGQIMSAANLLAERPSPSDADIDAGMSGNVCRCATYVRIRSAIHRAAEIAGGGRR